MLKEDIKLKLEQLFPNAGCELDYRNIYELSVAVILSAQTTDKSVNLVTPNLFSKYPTVDDLASAKEEDVQKIDTYDPIAEGKKQIQKRYVTLLILLIESPSHKYL